MKTSSGGRERDGLLMRSLIKYLGRRRSREKDAGSLDVAIEATWDVMVQGMVW